MVIPFGCGPKVLLAGGPPNPILDDYSGEKYDESFKHPDSEVGLIFLRLQSETIFLFFLTSDSSLFGNYLVPTTTT